MLSLGARDNEEGAQRKRVETVAARVENPERGKENRERESKEETQRKRTESPERERVGREQNPQRENEEGAEGIQKKQSGGGKIFKLIAQNDYKL